CARDHGGRHHGRAVGGAASGRQRAGRRSRESRMSRGLRRDISPRAVTIITAFVLAAILFVYWWGLVRKTHMPRSPMGGGGGGPAVAPPALGRDDVQVEPFAGIAPGYRDGPSWQAEFAGPNALAL